MNNTQGTQSKPQPAATPNDASRDAVDKGAKLGARAAEAGREGINKVADLQETAATAAQQFIQNGVATASRHALETGDRLSQTLGFSGEDSERLARQSKQNLEAVTRCGTVLSQAFQDTSRSWFELSQKQWQRNLEGLTKLTKAKSVQEFSTVQSELARDGLQHMVQDSRAIAEKMRSAVDDAGKAFTA